MIDKNSKFSPSEKETYRIAKNYWDGLTKSREKILEHLSEVIKSNASSGAYSITQMIPKKDEKYIKEKLEDVGYEVLFRENPNDANMDFIIVSFNKE
ncbi:hypothetical protein AGR56_18540 [Clostridium sp. DMHC 10]|uniref:hypothetical protein n=1 Tax=Clostridium sp. DMHC 10 TaxID=747377 RepID=UPI00069EDF23|nr:hypothetical protein [Clostridium sp. DMHC 10]KOF55791.1 hypothetical protein AGR56_18540 [Clostridium sp. DMHC 10]